MTLSVLAIIFGSWIFGLIALLSTTDSNKGFKNGDYAKYESSKKRAKIMLIIALIVGILNFIVSFFIFSGFAS